MEEETMMMMIPYPKPSPNTMATTIDQQPDHQDSDSNCNISYDTSSVSVRRFKGVVPQQNGHWGAQLYLKNQRIWLGTFKSEDDAAMAYDSAANSLLSPDSHRNFPSSIGNLLERKFQGYFSTDVILGMIRDGTYQSKLADFLRNQRAHLEVGLNLSLTSSSVQGFLCSLLFQKELTPSDVGKLNRLVIPKRYAVKHFPNVPDSSEQQDLDGHRGVDEVQLEFYDRHMSIWKFRYCYWKSSQSFVFTRGWNRFVKDKGLRANDTIAFYTCERRGGARQSFLVIDVACRDTKTTGMDVGKVGDRDHLACRDTKTTGMDVGKVGDRDHTASSLVEVLDSTTPTKGFRLFGVQIYH